MKRLLILGTARNYILDYNFEKIRKIFATEEWEYIFCATKKYDNSLISENIILDKSYISPLDKINIKKIDAAIICQGNYFSLDYCNIYLFLKNMNIKEKYVIYKNNYLKKIKKIRFSLIDYLIYKILKLVN